MAPNTLCYRIIVSRYDPCPFLGGLLMVVLGALVKTFGKLFPLDFFFFFFQFINCFVGEGSKVYF